MSALLSKKELEAYSLANALRTANVRNIGAGNSLEVEVTSTIRRRMEEANINASPEGCYIPYQVLTRALSATTAGAGGFTVADLRGPVQPFPFPQSVAYRLGANTLTDLTGDFGLPVLRSSDEAQWLAEGASADESKDSSFASVAATPRRLTGTRKISRQLREQMSQSSEAFMAATITGPASAALDRAGLAGQGGVSPLGLLYTPSVGTVSLGTDGGTVALTNLNDVEGDVLGANFALDSAGYALSTKTRTKLKNTPKAASTSTYLLETMNGADFCNGFRSYPTTFMPDSLSKGSGSSLGSLIFGDWSKLNICLWGALGIVVNPFSLAASGTEIWTVTVFADIVLTRPQAFARCVDVVTT